MTILLSLRLLLGSKLLPCFHTTCFVETLEFDLSRASHKEFVTGRDRYIIASLQIDCLVKDTAIAELDYREPVCLRKAVSLLIGLVGERRRDFVPKLVAESDLKHSRRSLLSSAELWLLTERFWIAFRER